MLQPEIARLAIVQVKLADWQPLNELDRRPRRLAAADLQPPKVRQPRQMPGPRIGELRVDDLQTLQLRERPDLRQPRIVHQATVKVEVLQFPQRLERSEPFARALRRSHAEPLQIRQPG